MPGDNMQGAAVTLCELPSSAVHHRYSHMRELGNTARHYRPDAEVIL